MAEALTAAQPMRAFRFSGHESFSCRYAWLSKAYRALSANRALFSDEEDAMLKLGIGKNMVRSLRFWVDVMGVAAPSTTGREFELAEFGNAIFGMDGLDPYLEDVTTLWLLHWKLVSNRTRPLFAWDYLINHWPMPEFTRSEALAAFHRESRKLDNAHSDATLSQHLDVFLHTYLPSRATAAGVEDSLDGPLVDLNFLLPFGERRGDTGRWEPVYAFRREAKSEISAALFDYCLMDFWQTFSPNEDTLSLRAVTLAPASPGQIFKLPEDDVRARLEEWRDREYETPYKYQPSAVQGLLTVQKAVRPLTLSSVYGRKTAHA